MFFDYCWLRPVLVGLLQGHWHYPASQHETKAHKGVGLQEPEWAEESGQEGYVQLEVDDKG